MTSLKTSDKVDIDFAKKTATVTTKPGAVMAEKDVVAALKKAGYGMDKFAEIQPIKKPAKKEKKDVKPKKGGGTVMVNITGMT